MLAVTVLPYFSSVYSQFNPRYVHNPQTAGISGAINDFARRYAHFLNKESQKPFKIIGVVADEYSSDKLGQRWPFKRSTYARLIRKLDGLGVKTIAFDLLFAGKSENEQDDLELSQAIKESVCRIVLPISYNFENKTFVDIPKELNDFAYAVGVVNVPADPDEVIRRVWDEFPSDKEKRYSFIVQIAAAFLDKPAREITPDIPHVRSGEFLVNYVCALGDKNKFGQDILKTINLFQIIDDAELAKLKEQYGQNFLKGHLVFVYAGGISRDIKATPLGNMAGCLINMNGVINILTGKFLSQNNFLGFGVLFICFAAIFYILTRLSFIVSFVSMIVVMLMVLWLAIAGILKGVFFDLSQIVIFCVLFFIAGSLYKYLYFLTQLLKIKSKATMDPLRGIFTTRYFYYQLELQKKVYCYYDLYLVFVYLESFRAETSGMSLPDLKSLWQGIQAVINTKKSFWSTYSQEELIGGLFCPGNKISSAVQLLKNELEMIFREKQINSKVRVGFVKYKKEYPTKELVFVLFKELKEKKLELLAFNENELTSLFKFSVSKLSEEDKVLDSLDQDIEERNRELLTLVESLNKEHAHSKEIFFQVITSLVNALEARDPYTMGHSQRVCNYALRLADKLGWNKEELEKLKKAALLHDLGKIGIPDSILHKAGKLTDEEFDFIKKHEIIAVKILEPIKEIANLLNWILYHHEKWDGKGYPYGLGGNAIPLASQIISIADVFDALTTGRDYKQSMSYDDSINELVKGKGTQFKPELVDIFIEVIKETKS